MSLITLRNSPRARFPASITSSAIMTEGDSLIDVVEDASDLSTSSLT